MQQPLLLARTNPCTNCVPKLNRFERDMTTLEAQQDLYFITFSALLNISVLRSAQPMVAKKGLLVLLGTSTLLYNRVAQ